MKSREFYKSLKTFASARQISDPSQFVEAPADWHLVLSDVKGSTRAIEEGRYKEVNITGASTIMAVINALPGFEFPYTFGGDGATLLVHEDELATVRKTLLGVRRRSREAYGLELRVGCVSIRELLEARKTIRVAKYALSKSLHLAMFSGGGMSFAEDLIKNPPSGSSYLWDDDDSLEEASFEGLECRWQPVPAQKGEIISVLIRALSDDTHEASRVYAEVIEEIELIAGSSEQLNPVTTSKLKLTLSPQKLRAEQKLKSSSLWRIWLASAFGRAAMRFNAVVGGVNWFRYRQEVQVNTDFWKYDDMLRFVIDVSPVQQRALRACFENRFQRGQIVFGVHSSREALMTCLVLNREGSHVHFVDGNDGGYALAAKELKSRLKDSGPATHGEPRAKIS